VGIVFLRFLTLSTFSKMNYFEYMHSLWNSRWIRRLVLKPRDHSITS